MNVEHIWAVRDARGLNAKEKVFLFVLISRGQDGMFATWTTNAQDMGLSKRGYYDTRASLLEKGLIKAVRAMNGSTTYFLADDPFPYGESDSHMGNSHSRMGNEDSRSDETKENNKNNMKEELEEELQAAPVVADAPTVTASSNSQVKEEFEKIVKAVSFEPFTSLNFEEDDPARSLFENMVFGSRTAQDWLAIQRKRPLTQAEKDFKADRSAAYWLEHAPVDPDLVEVDW